MNRIAFFGATNVGKVRGNNEDAFICQYLWDEEHLLCVAIDGLGGYEGGEIAAGIAKETIVNYLNNNRMGDLIDLLKQAVTQANNDIVAHQTQNPGCNRMGCVLTAGLFDLQNGQLNVAHVGDSRLYQWHEGNLRKLTHDHSLVGYREDSGLLTEEEAMNHPQRNIVERVLGDKVHHLEDKGFIEAAIFPVQDGMNFLFCSDGLTDMITSAEISLIIQNNEDNLQDCVQALIESACDHGGKDNVTVVMARYSSDGKETSASDTDLTSKVVPPVFCGHEAVDTSETNDAPSDSVVSAPQLPEDSAVMTDDQTMADVALRHDPVPEPEKKHRRPWLRIVLTLLSALAACLAALYAGYQIGYSQHHSDLESSIQQRDSVVSALQDSIMHLEQDKYDQSVKMDSLINAHK